MLKMISSPYCTLPRVCFCFLFCHVRHHKNVNNLQLLVLTWSKYNVSCQPPLSMQSFMLCSISYHLMKQLPSSKNQWSWWEKTLKGYKDMVCGLWRITFAFHLPWSQRFFLIFLSMRWENQSRLDVSLSLRVVKSKILVI